MNQTLVLTAPRILTLENRPPLQPQPGQVVVAPQFTGICGTDLALFSGDYPVPLPLVCGHEFAGRIVRVGEGVSGEWTGRRVVAEINNTCLAGNKFSPCKACRLDISSHCQRRTVTGIINKDGAFAQEITVPAGVIHMVPEPLDLLTAVLTEPLAAALQTFEMTPVRGDETLVVLGPGRLGILIVWVAAQMGLKVLAVSRSGVKRSRALDFGAGAAVEPEDAAAWVRDQTEGLGADLVVDATGRPEGLAAAQELVRPRGVICVKTTCGLPSHGLDLTRLVVDEVRLQGSRCGPFPKALDLLLRNRETLQSLITSVRPLSEAQAAMESAVHEGKVVLEVAAI